MDDVRDAQGQSGYIPLLRDARNLCAAIREERLRTHPLITAMARIWDRDRVVLYFEKLIELELKRECLRIGLASWMMHGTLSHAPSLGVLVVERTPWFSSLAEYAHRHGVRLVGYRTIDLGRLAKICRGALRAISRALSAEGHAPHSPPGKRAGASRAGAAWALAVRYGHRTLSLDPLDRSEFFWLHGSTLPASEILLYSPSAPLRVDAAVREQLQRRGISVQQGGPLLTRRSIVVGGRLVGCLLREALVCVVRRQAVSWYEVKALVHLAYAYGRWHDFFLTHRIRVHLATFNTDVTDVGLALALDTLNGVSVAYQCSVSHLLHPTTFLSAGEHAQMVFSPLFEDLWRSVGAPAASYVPTGYIYDGAFAAALSSRSRLGDLRGQLQAQGARFILCFFDENSARRWDRSASNEGAAHDYEYLFRWLLADPALGLIVKVKHSNVFERIQDLAPLIEQARRSGRCRFLTSHETLLGSVFPAEAALMADLCIGKLIGSTAALEARLAGVRTLLIDPQGFVTHPLRVLGVGRVVFDDWDALHVAVERYRAEPHQFQDLGDWSPMLEAFDPFRDGRASERMATYLCSLLEGLNAGRDRDAVLADAAERYAARWGRNKVVHVNATGRHLLTGDRIEAEVTGALAAAQRLDAP